MFRRNSFFLLCTSLSCLPSVQANAGCCCDWLFGRTSSPYVVGYAPYASYSYALNGPFTANPYAAGYPAVAGSVVPMGGTYQAQMQTYDNPSVYTGRPVILNQGQTQMAYRLPLATATSPVAVTSPGYSVNYGANYGGANLFGRTPTAIPLAESFRGPATSGNPFYGTGNVYPSTNQATAFQSNDPSVGVAGSSAVTSIPTGLPPSAYPAAPIAPIFADSAQPQVGGLARFFGSLLGTNYRSSYYRAPITYYRPITSIDPVSGTTVTVQQPCTSYVQQLQRIPYSSLQPGLIAPTVTPVGAPVLLDGSQCPTGYAVAPTAAYPTTISPFDPQSSNPALGQVGGYTSPNDRLVVPIPSTQEPGYNQQPSGLNPAPLTGAAADDRAPVDQPRLESARPSSDEGWWRRDDSTGSGYDPNQETGNDESAEPSSYLQRIEYGDRTAANELRQHDAAKQAHGYHVARPIAAPEGFSNPFERPVAQPVTPVNRHDLVAPPLPPARLESTNDRESYSASAQISAPVREATQRTPVVSYAPSSEWQPAKPKRDNTWYSSK